MDRGIRENESERHCPAHPGRRRGTACTSVSYLHRGKWKMAVVFERANVAVSADPLGTVAGLQFVAVFQSPELGLRSHVALPAWLVWMQSIKINALKIAVTSGSGVFTGSRRMVRDVQPCPAFIS